MAKCHPIIVLGVERSGTSVVAEMVHGWGAYAGESEKLTEANELNPQGYWEYKPLWDFLVELGDFSTGASWWDVSFQERIKEKLSTPSYRESALALVADMEKAGKPWVWKDPALSFFLPFWKAIWGDAAYIITVRNPSDTARSWEQFVMPPKLAGSVSLITGNLLRWQYMMSLILAHTEETERKIFIPYEELMQEPRKQADRLYAFLNQNVLNQNNCDAIVPNAARIEIMAERVNPALWHNRNQTPFTQIQEATNEQKALYQFVKSKVESPLKKFERTKYPMPPGWIELMKNQEALIRAYSGAIGLDN
jgi:hypothetical protein